MRGMYLPGADRVLSPDEIKAWLARLEAEKCEIGRRLDGVLVEVEKERRETPLTSK